MALNSQLQTVMGFFLLAASAGTQIDLNPPRDPSVIRVDVDLVNLLCTVRDKDGATVKDLSKQDFVVLDEGRRQTITQFAREVNSPLTVALLLDVSGSVANILKIEKAAASQFFSNVLRPGDRALLVGFAQYVIVWQNLTSSRDDLDTALKQRAGPCMRCPERRPPVAERCSAMP